MAKAVIAKKDTRDLILQELKKLNESFNVLSKSLLLMNENISTIDEIVNATKNK